MRNCLTILALCATLSASFAETTSEFFAGGMKYFLNGDYTSAKEMFKNSISADGDVGAMSRFYLASIAAYLGDKNAEKLFVDALKNPPKEKNSRIALITSFGKFALANGKYKLCAEVLKPFADKPDCDSLTAWFYAEALFLSGKKDEAKNYFSKILSEKFGDPDATGVDMFADGYVSGGEFAKSFDIAKLRFDTPAAEARKSVMGGKKISVALDKISFYCLVDAAESGDKIDEKLLAEESYKYRDTPFAWRGYLALSTNAFRAGRYADAETYARDAVRLSPPDIVERRFPLMALADAFRLQKKYDDARLAYEKIFMNRRARGECVAEALYKTGLCWYEQGEWGKAHMYFERVFVGYFYFEYWGSRAYYYDARALFTLGQRRNANATLIEYFRRAKLRDTEIYKQAREFYRGI